MFSSSRKRVSSVPYRCVKAMQDNPEHQNQPWYRNPMVWLVILFPSLAVIGGIITIVIAMNTEDGLVVDNYYKKGLEINQDIRHDQTASELGISAFVDVNARTGEILVSISSEKELELPQSLAFHLIHRTRSGQDQQTMLSRMADSAEYRGYLRPPVIEGRWTIQVGSENHWRLRQNLTTKSAEHILMNITS